MYRARVRHRTAWVVAAVAPVKMTPAVAEADMAQPDQAAPMAAVVRADKRVRFLEVVADRSQRTTYAQRFSLVVLAAKAAPMKTAVIRGAAAMVAAL